MIMMDEQEYLDHLFDEYDASIKLDMEQREVILNDSEALMVIAGAGAGKTTTMAGKVKYLVEQKKIEPETIVMISLTNQAVYELQDKINRSFQIPAHILTFHKFGIKILKECGIRKRVCNNADDIIPSFLKQKLQDARFRSQFLNFFAYDFEISKSYIQNSRLLKRYIEKIEYLSLCGKVQLHNEEIKRNLEEQNRSITNEMMVTREEVIVANYLFLHGISYCYQKPYPYSFDYLPDFTLEVGGRNYYIDLVNDQSFSFRCRYYKWKTMKLHSQYHTTQILLSSNDIIEELEEALREHSITGRPKTDYEIYTILEEIKKDQSYMRFIHVCNTFLHSFKTNGHEIDDFNMWKKEYAHDRRTTFFLDLLSEMYEYYEHYLEQRDEMDFDDMIRFATKRLQEETLALPYRYIIVDEYQDISRERFLFLKAVVKASHAKLIVVGDDWQSIFAFAGSDISLFMNFEQELPAAKRLTITHTYRNSQELIDLAGNFVMKNQYQFQKQLTSPKHLERPVKIYLYDDSKPFPQEKIKALEECIGAIVEKSSPDIEILLIGRYKKDIDPLIDHLHFHKEEDFLQSTLYPQVTLTFMTAHASKGLGFPHVIIINGENGEYGFPSEKINDPILDLVIAYDDSYEDAEERRLFYVALTRTKNMVFIIAPVHSSSRFLKELSSAQIINRTKYRWKNKKLICPRCHFPLVRNFFNTKHIQPLYQCTNDRKKCGFETNHLDFMKKIKICPECRRGYLIVKRSENGYFMGCTNYRNGCNYHKNI